MATEAFHSPTERRNRNVAVILFLVAAGMVGAAYAAVPLYELFCNLTAYGGTTQVASYSSMIAGPVVPCARSARRTTGVSSQPRSRPK